MPFDMSKTELARRAGMIQRGLCAYDIFPAERYDNLPSSTPPKPPNTCDCKYGAQKPASRSEEQNGCPEMREITAILNEMTAAEYKTIMKRIHAKIRKRVRAMNKEWRERNKCQE